MNLSSHRLNAKERGRASLAWAVISRELGLGFADGREETIGFRKRL